MADRAAHGGPAGGAVKAHRDHSPWAVGFFRPPTQGAMNPDEAFERYRELQAYVGWTDEAARLVVAVAGLVEPYLPALIDDFYAEIDRHPEARKVITGGPAQ